MFFLFLRPKKAVYFFFIIIFNMGISIDISVYPCQNYFSKSEKPIFTKFLVQVYDVP